MRSNMVSVPPVLLLFLAIFSSCGSGGEDAKNTDETELVLSLEELSAYNGKDGNPAYIAVDGIIYDVTSGPEWSGGEHNSFTGRRDLTNEIKNVTPHGLLKLRNGTIVGRSDDE